MQEKTIRLTIASFVSIALGVFALYGINRQMFHMDDSERELSPTKFEKPWETMARLRKESEPAMLKECTNYLGFSRMIDYRLNNYDDQITNWTGSASIDFLNHFGGMDRTNLYFRFYAGEHIFVAPDDIKMIEQWAEAYKADYARTHQSDH
jgi:hypothetical protein